MVVLAAKQLVAVQVVLQVAELRIPLAAPEVLAEAMAQVVMVQVAALVVCTSEQLMVLLPVAVVAVAG
jgi:hypothetical protein